MRPPAVMLDLLSAFEIHDPLFWSFSLFLEVVSWFHILPCNWILHVPWLDGSTLTVNPSGLHKMRAWAKDPARTSWQQQQQRG